MAYLPASRAVDTVGMHPMFYGRVSGVGSMGPRPVDPTETTFVARGKIYETRTLDHPTYGKQTINYETQVTVKNYVPGSGQVSYTTWGDGLYPGFNPTPNWKTVSEAEFTSMFPMWTNIRNNKFGQTKEQAAAEKAESDASFARYQQEAADRQKKLDEMKSWRSNTPIFSWTTTAPSGESRTVKVYGYNKELKAVWIDEGPNASADNSMLVSEAVLASKSPEWVAWKSGSTSALPLPLLIGAAFLLLS
jgi:hypothetical protein